ncbi:MAG: ATP-binding protein [Prevotella sp.]|nr:ATP-binding protein [Prevotella sp.]
MDIRILERALLDQRSDLETLKKERFCHRVEEKLINMKSNLAQVVIGVRRSGKSTLCLNALERAKVKYAYVNFDDDRIDGLQLSDLDNVLEVLYKIYGNFTHLFIDEIQNIEGWHLFANRMLRKRIHLVLTGSNSRLLGGELASHLTGRHHTIELLPFSFVDFCNYRKIQTGPLTTKNRGLLAAAFDEYVKQGGFPELMIEETPKSYIDSLLHDIVVQDIQKRYKVRYIDTLLGLVNHLLNESPSLIVKEKLMSLFSFNSTHTLGNYLTYLTQAYLISTISKYSPKSRVRAVGQKCYAIDVAMMNNRANAFANENVGWRMETIVYLELRRRAVSVSQDVYYYADRTAEADFIVCDGNIARAVYQVTYTMENEKTRKREIRGAVAAAKAAKCSDIYIITDHESGTVTSAEGYEIKIMAIWEWLCASASQIKN